MISEVSIEREGKIENTERRSLTKINKYLFINIKYGVSL
jgi:hypothetical protein